MLKKTAVLAAALAMVLVAVSFASAQESVVATGVLERPEATTYMYGTHAIIEEATGTYYALGSADEGLLDSYVGQRITVYGTLVPGYEEGQVEGGPPLLEVIWVQPS